jgi:hypothetical protein
MKNRAALRILIPIIGLLALLAAASGLFYQTDGEPYAYTNHRGETVMINGRGLYYYDTVSSAAQMQANDLITLAIGLPLLAIAAWQALRGSLRGQLLLTGTVGFFLYTYMSMSMLTAYNAWYLVYVALFGLSLWAFVLSLTAIDVKTLPDHIASTVPRGLIAGLLFLVGGFLSLAWLGRVLGPWLNGSTPPLENTTTLVIQTMDLGLIAPLAIVAGVLLLRRNPWGYLLASVLVMKAVSMGLAVSTMSLNMARVGVPDSLGIMVPFLVITVLNLMAAVALLRSIDRPVHHLRPV